MSCRCYRSLTLPHGAMGWSVVFHCGISLSYSLTFCKCTFVWFLSLEILTARKCQGMWLAPSKPNSIKCKTKQNKNNTFIWLCSGIQFYLLLSPYLCFISLLYLDLYVLRDDALISWGSFMQTKYLCVLIHIWIKGEVGALWNRFKPSSKIFYWPFQGGTSFVDLLCFFLSCVCYVFVHVCLYVLCGHLLGKGWPLGSRLWCLTVSL